MNAWPSPVAVLRRFREGRFPLLKLALAFAALMTIAVLLLRNLEAAAERTTVEATVMNLRALLRLRIAQALAQADEGQLRQLVGANPMGWMDPPAGGYVGVRHGAAQGNLPSGGWSFDPDRRELVYRPVHARDLDWPAGSPQVLRWQVRAGAPTGLSRGIELVAVEPVPWSGQPLR